MKVYNTLEEIQRTSVIERNSLVKSDCLDVMRFIPEKSIDMIFTDPPFGSTNCKWDSPVDLVRLWEQYKRIIKPNGAILMFAQTPFDKVLGSSNLPWLKYEWIWEKTQATGHLNAKKMPMKAHENILVFYEELPIYNPQKTYGHKPINSYTKYVETQNNTNIYGKMNREISGGGETDRYPRSVLKYASDKQKKKKGEKMHDTQKPIALIENLIKTYTNPGQLVLDTFAGNGTVGVACKNLKRDFIMIEKEQYWVESTIKRINNL
jgi:site-specific DNA-methyltransferase (adenine-specific)